MRDFLNQQIAAFRDRYPEAVDSGLLLDIVALHTTPMGTADQRDLEELQQKYAHLDVTLPDLLQQCQDLYLLSLTTSAQREGAKTSRLAHDTLAPLIREQYDESDKPGQRARRILDNRSAYWARENSGPPLDETDLNIVEQGLKGTRKLTEIEDRLLQTSRELRAKLQRNRRILKITGAVASVVISILGVFGWVKYTQAESRRIELNLQTIELSEKKNEIESTNGNLARANKRLNDANGELQRQIWIATAQRLAAMSLTTLKQTPVQSLLLAMESVESTTHHDLPAETVAHQTLRDTLSAVGGRGLSGHGDSIYSAAISPDGRWLATGSADQTVRLWDLTDENPEKSPLVLRGHTGTVLKVAISPDGHWLATGSSDKTARLWDLTAENPATSPVELRGHRGPIYSVAISPDNRWGVTGSHDRTARLWDLTADNPAMSSLRLEGHQDSILKVAVSPDGHWLVTGSGDKTARLWNLNADDPAASSVLLKGHEDWIYSLAFTADSRRLVTGSFDKTAGGDERDHQPRRSLAGDRQFR